LIGGSIGLRARELGWAVLGWDPDPEAVAVGLRRGALSAAAESLHSLSEGAGVLVLAGPVDATLGHLAELVRAGSPAPLVIDVGSVKAGVARAGRELAAFVPTHPIAGSESSGAEAARADLFRGRIWTYDPVALPPARELALRFIAAMGAAPFAIDSRAHDRPIALTSHLPQLLSAALRFRHALDAAPRRVLVLDVGADPERKRGPPRAGSRSARGHTHRGRALPRAR
jgi:prephenate dehydrogenase